MAEAPTSAKTAQRAARKAAYQAEKQRNRVLETIARAEGVSDAASLVSGAPTAQLWLLNGGVARGIAQPELAAQIRRMAEVAGNVTVLGDRRHAFALVLFDAVDEATRAWSALRRADARLEAMGELTPLVEFATQRHLSGSERVCAVSSERGTAEQGFAVSDVPGLRLIADFVSEAEEADMLADIDARPWIALSNRRVQHYGFAFDYSRNNVDPSRPLPLPHPRFFDLTLDRLEQLAPGLVPARCDQLTLNEYVPPHSSIPPHVDTHHAFEDAILSLSLASHTVMDFRLPVPLTDAAGTAAGTIVKRASVLLPRRSLVVLTGAARYAWWHSISDRATDVVDGRLVQRSRRVSLTFRRVRLAPVCACPFVEYCPTQLAEVERKRAAGVARDLETSVERQHVAGVYDVIAPHFAATRYKPWPRVADFVAALRVGDLLFDVGCGNGRYMAHDRRILHVGLDRSIGLLEQCRELHAGSEVCYGSALALPYRDGCADAAMSIAVIHHFSTLERRVDAVREMARVVRRGGPILITAWAWEQDKFKHEPSQDLFVKWFNKADGVTYNRYYHLFVKGELEQLCAAVDTVELAESYYDTDNWVVVLRVKAQQ